MQGWKYSYLNQGWNIETKSFKEKDKIETKAEQAREWQQFGSKERTDRVDQMTHDDWVMMVMMVMVMMILVIMVVVVMAMMVTV